jgi:hypothetical protein
MNGRKISRKYENPLDNILIDLANYITPLLYNNKITPNMITTLSLILGILSSIFLYKDKCKLAALFTLLAYFFDCVDGHLARKYNMVTIFGDYYDHFSDIFKFSLILVIFYIKNKKKFFKIIIPITIMFLLMIIHFGCQEIIYDVGNAPTLSLTEPFCPKESYITITKYFGCGTFISVFIYLIYNYNK